MEKITIYKRDDENTRPRGFGNPPTYHILEDAPRDKDFVWWTPIEITIPEGYTVAQCNDWQYRLFDSKGRSMDILDWRDHPCIIDLDTPGYPRYIRLDK